MRVPLISPVTAVIYRLDIQATWAVDPPGTLSTGYDKTLREPIRYTSGTDIVSPRQEMTAVRVPCQVEMQAFERLQQTFPGNDLLTNIVFVFHRKDLKTLSLLNADTGRCLLKTGDRIDHIEKRSRTVETYDKPLYIYEVRPRSWGFGTDGYDLEVAYTTFRAGAQRG